MEATYPLCHKEPVPPNVMGVFCDELFLYGVRELE